jgi:hypothetical protein
LAGARRDSQRQGGACGFCIENIRNALRWCNPNGGSAMSPAWLTRYGHQAGVSSRRSSLRAALPMLMPIRMLPLLLLSSLAAAPIAQAAQKHCLPYGPIKVTLSGKLERPTGAVEPGSQVLMLPTPVCVAASPAGQAPRHDDVHRLRLALSKDQAAHLEEEGAGQIVRVTGMLSEVAQGKELLLTVVGVDSD